MLLDHSPGIARTVLKNQQWRLQAVTWSRLALLPLTTLTHVAVGETREVGGREESLDSWHPACPASSPATPEEGEAECRGAWRADRSTAGLLHPPTPFGGGGGAAGSRTGGQSEGEENLP